MYHFSPDSYGGLYLLRFDRNLPIMKFSIQTTWDLKISCYRKSSKIPVRKLLELLKKLVHFSQLDNIIVKVRALKTDINTEMKLSNREFTSLIKDLPHNIVDDLRHKI